MTSDTLSTPYLLTKKLHCMKKDGEKRFPKRLCLSHDEGPLVRLLKRVFALIADPRLDHEVNEWEMRCAF